MKRGRGREVGKGGGSSKRARLRSKRQEHLYPQIGNIFLGPTAKDGCADGFPKSKLGEVGLPIGERQCHVDPGRHVVAVMESMKMEISIRAAAAGTASNISVSNGDMVERGQIIAEILPPEE